jgi:xylulokinase
MILAIDIGTSSAKAGLFTGSGHNTFLSREEIPQTVSTDPAVHEARASAWLGAVGALSTNCVRHSRNAKEEIDCIVVSGNGPTLVPIGADGKALGNAITWMDRRAVEEARIAGEAVGRELDPTYNLPKALWFMRHKPEVYEKTKWFMSCPEFVCGALTGVWTTFLPAEGFQPIIWSNEALRLLGLDETKFPPFIKPGNIVGFIGKKASEELGLPKGIPVVAGGPDFVAALVGSATTVPGRACDRAGTSEGINLCNAGEIVADRRLLFMPHIIEPYTNISGVISTSGRAVSWFMDLVGKSPCDLARADHSKGIDAFFSEVESSEPGAGGLIFLPYLAGERAPIWDPAARGTFVGLSLGHGRREMARAVAESTAFAMRDIIETMEEIGAEVKELRVTGSPSRNSVWNKIKADITGKPLLEPDFSDAELLGDVCLASVALEKFESPAAAAERLFCVKRVYEPDKAHSGLYRDLFEAYRESYRALKPVFARIVRNAGKKAP